MISLSLLETSLASNHDTIMSIKRTASSAGMLESFFEAAPQLLLQLTIGIEDEFRNISELKKNRISKFLKT